MNEPLPCAALMAGSAPDATPVDRYRTHAVLNQAEPACGFNAYTGDAVLRAAIAREAPWRNRAARPWARWPATNRHRSWRGWPTGMRPS